MISGPITSCSLLHPVSLIRRIMTSENKIVGFKMHRVWVKSLLYCVSGGVSYEIAVTERWFLRLWSQSQLKPNNMEHGFLLLLLFIHLFLPYSFGKPSGVCVSQGGRFPLFKSEGNPPKKGPKDLTLCRVFRKKTCCDVTQTHPALLAVRKLASTGEASQECLNLWELLECSICDPHVGVHPGPPLICASFCERIYEACLNAYFSMDVKTQILAPCGVNDFVCGRAAEWVSNGTDLCVAAGFRVKPSDNVHIASEETSCYGDMASLGSVSDSWKASQFQSMQKGDSLRMIDDFQQWVREMPFSERVSWAIGGMVLTAGLVFISKRKSHSQRQKLAAIKRTARKLEGRMVEQRPASAQEIGKRNSR